MEKSTSHGTRPHAGLPDLKKKKKKSIEKCQVPVLVEKHSKSLWWWVINQSAWIRGPDEFSLSI